jgi:nitrite reductase [NAD(P)H] small subunit
MTAVTLGPVADIPVGEGRAFAVDVRQIAVFRLRNGTLRAVVAVCPHRGEPLADGIADEQVVICPLHNHTYDLATGEEITSGGGNVRAYDVDIDTAGMILLRIDEQASA